MKTTLGRDEIYQVTWPGFGKKFACKKSSPFLVEKRRCPLFTKNYSPSFLVEKSSPLFLVEKSLRPHFTEKKLLGTGQNLPGT